MPTEISVVPPEVIGAIFKHLVPQSLVIPSRDFDALSSVTETCSEWRAIAFQLPNLWDDLSIRLHSWSDRRTIHLAVQSLHRSQKSALSVRIHVKKYLDYGKTEKGISPPTFLFPHFARIWDVNALVLRSGCTITRLSVGCILHWDQLLENSLSLEELNTEGALPRKTMRNISTGDICPALQSLTCAVTVEDINIFLNMLESRARTNETCTFSRIRDVSAQCLDFSLDERQWERIHSLRTHITVTENRQRSQTSWWGSGW